MIRKEKAATPYWLEPTPTLCPAKTEVVWECDAFHKTAENAADEFATTYWQEPRKRTPLLYVNGVYRFSLKDGRRSYELRLVDNVPTIYRITAFDERPPRVERCKSCEIALYEGQNGFSDGFCPDCFEATP